MESFAGLFDRLSSPANRRGGQASAKHLSGNGGPSALDDQGIGARFLRRKAEGPLERGGEVAGMFVAGVERDLANRRSVVPSRRRA